DWSPRPPTSYAMARPLSSFDPEESEEEEVEVPPQAERARAREAVAAPATVIREIRRMVWCSCRTSAGRFQQRRWLRRSLSSAELDWAPRPPTSYAMARPLSSFDPEESEEEEVEVPPQAERARAREAVAAPATVIREIRRMVWCSCRTSAGRFQQRRWLRRRLTRVELPETPFCPPCYAPVAKPPYALATALPTAKRRWPWVM